MPPGCPESPVPVPFALGFAAVSPAAPPPEPPVPPLYAPPLPVPPFPPPSAVTFIAPPIDELPPLEAFVFVLGAPFPPAPIVTG